MTFDSIKREIFNFQKTWPIFSSDREGLGIGKNLYGTHPFYMVMEDDGSSHGVFLMNSNAMEYAMIPAPGLVIRTIGGLFDFHIYTGPTPENVIEQHTHFVGRPFIPPYWSLGFHLSKYGYDNLTNMEAAVNRTIDAEIPLDVVYADIDTMDGRKDFTYDKVNFAGLPKYFSEDLHNMGLRSVTILDPTIANTSNYKEWETFSNADAFIKWENGKTIMAYAWPDEPIGFPDFFDENGRKAWIDTILDYTQTMQVDGLWIVRFSSLYFSPLILLLGYERTWSCGST